MPISELLSDAIAVISTLERRELEFEVAEASQPERSAVNAVNQDRREEGVGEENQGREGVQSPLAAPRAVHRRF
jgi:hypothetical protein